MILSISGILWLFVPKYVEKKLSPLQNGAYHPAQDKIKRELISPENQSLPKISFNKDEMSYSIFFGKGRGLTEGNVKITYRGKIYAASPKNDEIPLEFVTYQQKTFENNLGSAEGFEITWKIPEIEYMFKTSLFCNPEKQIVLSEILFPEQITGIKTSKKEELAVQFPLFKNDSINQRCLTFRDFEFAPPQSDFTFVTAPVLLYDDAFNTVLFSTLNHFMTHGIKKCVIDNDQYYHCGLNGLIDEIPKMHTSNFIFVFGKGINASFMQWGNLIRKFHNVERKSRYSDITTKFLGYWTDNGAYYYYNSIPGKKMDQTLIKVDQYAQSLNIPFRYYQLDSWWYQKSVKKFIRFLLGWYGKVRGGAMFGGTLKWEQDPAHFDLSLNELSKKLGNKPFICHNRWYSAESPRINEYSFHVNGKNAFSTDPRFWEMIMQYCKDHNIEVYEQDWLSIHMHNFPILWSEIGLAEKWLTSMANAAEKTGVYIQLCMANPSIFLQQIHFPSVTTIRSSNDYNVRWPHNYNISFFTQTSMLTHAIGAIPFKDTFQESSPGLFSYVVNPELNVLISALSTGPVGPGSKIKGMHSEWLLASCRSDGLLLKPDRPITAIDLMYIPHSKYYIASTESNHNDFNWYYVVTMNLWPKIVKDKIYTLKELNIHGNFIEYSWDEENLRKIDENTPIFSELKKDEYNYRLFAPLVNGHTIIGHKGKYAMMNDKEFSNVCISDSEIIFTISGLKNELYDVLLYSERKPSDILGIDQNEWEYDEKVNKLLLHLIFQDTIDKEIHILF